MKKIIVSDVVRKLVERDKSILSRSDFLVFSASSNDEVLGIHRAEKADLIITMLVMPGMDGEELCSVIRRDSELRSVSVILISSVRPTEIEKCVRAKANASLTLPLDLEQLSQKVNEFLNVPRREAYRVLLSVKVEGRTYDNSFMCTSVDISATGLLLETDKVLAQGERIECSFFVPGAQRLVLHGDVVRAGKKSGTTSQYGVRFVDVPKDAASAIEDFVRKKMERRS